MAEKRGSERKSARLKVRFWRAGEPDRVYSGYTSNVSLGGCFIQTEQPVGTAGRLQLELSGESTGFVCEAVVARSIKAPYELRQVKPSGMGVRFLTIEELLRAVLPGGLEAADSANRALRQDDSLSATPAQASADPGNPQGSPTPTPATTNSPNPVKAHDSRAQPSRPQRITDFEATSRTAKRAARRHPAAPPPKPAQTEDQEASKTSNPQEVDQPKPDHAFRIAPPTLDRLSALYHAELVKDRLFIPTSKTTKKGATVRVELVLPSTQEAADAKSIELFGVVSKQWSKNGDESGLEGLGIKLIDATSAKKAVGALIATL